MGLSGNVMHTTEAEATKLTGTRSWIEPLIDVIRDVRYAIRMLLRSPAYALVVIAVLALGIGGNLLTFGLFNALALSPLSGVPGSAELQFVLARTNSGRDVALSYRDYRYIRDQMRSYESLAGSQLQGFMLGTGAAARRVWGESVTGNYFDVLGVPAALGRTLRPSDEIVRQGHPVAVIADSLWRRDFGADPAIVGRTIVLDTVSLTVVGIADPGFHGSAAGLATEVFVPW
jgi:hypothetical protein